MVNNVPQQGDIIKIGLDPRVGHEQQGFRPVIILSNNIISKYTNVVIAAPISSTQRRLPLYYDLPDNLNTKGTVLEEVPQDFLSQLLNVTRRIFMI